MTLIDLSILNKPDGDVRSGHVEAPKPSTDPRPPRPWRDAHAARRWQRLLPIEPHVPRGLDGDATVKPGRVFELGFDRKRPCAEEEKGLDLVQRERGGQGFFFEELGVGLVKAAMDVLVGEGG